VWDIQVFTVSAGRGHGNDGLEQFMHCCNATFIPWCTGRNEPPTARWSRSWPRRTWHQKQHGLAPPCGGFSDGCWGQGLRPLHVRTNQPPAL